MGDGAAAGKAHVAQDREGKRSLCLSQRLFGDFWVAGPGGRKIRYRELFRFESPIGGSLELCDDGQGARQVACFRDPQGFILPGQIERVDGAEVTIKR